jgi:hypothetical protein
LSSIYVKSGIEDKRRLIGSMFVEKFDIEGLKHRTAEVTKAFSTIFVINKDLRGNKKWGKNLF